MVSLKDLWKNEHVKTGVLIVMVIVAFVAFWFGSKAILKTDTPYLVVISGSMCTRGIKSGLGGTNCDGVLCIFYPTLHIGDLIVVQGGLNAAEIKVGHFNESNPSQNGDVIVFHSPFERNKLIVHRAVDKWYDAKDGKWKFRTAGDGLRYYGTKYDPWVVSEDHIIGKVVFRIPLIGHVILFMQTLAGKIVVALIIVIVIIWEFFIPSEEETEKRTEEKPLE